MDTTMSTGTNPPSPTPRKVRPARTAAPTTPVKSNRTPGQILAVLGLLITVAGTLAVLWGSLLPWMTLRVFDLSIVVPGIVGLGAATASIALITLTRSRSYPILSVCLGLLCLGIGWQAQRTLGRLVARQVLEVKQRLGPVNARLEQVNLPPIEPFPVGVRSRDFTGPGPLWTMWGGAAIALGATIQFAGGRLGRTCAHCGRHWHAGRDIFYCSHCGQAAIAANRCTRCLTPLERHDRFCVQCGQPAT